MHFGSMSPCVVYRSLMHIQIMKMMYFTINNLFFFVFSTFFHAVKFQKSIEKQLNAVFYNEKSIFFQFFPFFHFPERILAASRAGSRLQEPGNYQINKIYYQGPCRPLPARYLPALLTTRNSYRKIEKTEKLKKN